MLNLEGQENAEEKYFSRELQVNMNIQRYRGKEMNKLCQEA